MYKLSINGNFKFTAAQAAKKLNLNGKFPIAKFTAAQAAKKSCKINTCCSNGFTAAQAAKKCETWKR